MLLFYHAFRRSQALIISSANTLLSVVISFMILLNTRSCSVNIAGQHQGSRVALRKGRKAFRTNHFYLPLGKEDSGVFINKGITKDSPRLSESQDPPILGNGDKGC